MKTFVLILFACALSASAEQDAAVQTTREKVRADLQAHHDAIRAQMNARHSTATTTYNTNGTFTVSGPFESDDLPNCKEISLTFKTAIVTNRVTNRVTRTKLFARKKP